MNIAIMMILAVVTFMGLVVNAENAAEPSLRVFPSPIKDENNQQYWLNLGRDEIEEAINRPRIDKVAKNVILFVGDGMGITVSTAGRIFKGQKQGHSGEEGYLVWERFPNVGLIKTYCLDKQVPDSASTATAFFSGVKGNYYTVGVNGNVKQYDCLASLKQENRVNSILDWAQEANKDTGIVTTTRISHATPAGLYAKSAERYWECDRKIRDYSEEAMACKDIPRQLVEDNPGKNIKVIFGGGRQHMGEPKNEDEEDSCKRTDGRNMVEEWRQHKRDQRKSHAYVTNTRELRSVNINDTEYVMGLFSDLHMPFELNRDSSLDGTPDIAELTEVAIKRLRRSDNGFFLMVEGGKIDKAMHITSPRLALEEVVAFEKAVSAALNMVDLEETLIIVTADHSHGMSMNGYPVRGNNILGVVPIPHDDVNDGLPYTTLMFATGHGYNYSWDGEKVVRMNLTGVDTTSKDFVSQAAVPTNYDDELHSGEDVAAYAIGPMAHLFHRLHEQTYVAYVMGYAACLGPYRNCERAVEHPINKYEIKNMKGTASGVTRATLSSTGIKVMFLVTLVNFMLVTQ